MLSAVPPRLYSKAVKGEVSECMHTHLHPSGARPAVCSLTGLRPGKYCPSAWQISCVQVLQAWPTPAKKHEDHQQCPYRMRACATSAVYVSRRGSRGADRAVQRPAEGDAGARPGRHRGSGAAQGAAARAEGPAEGHAWQREGMVSALSITCCVTCL